jgi:hypothetical protein
VGVEAFRGVGDEVQESLDTFWVALVHECSEVGVTVEYLADAELSKAFSQNAVNPKFAKRGKDEVRSISQPGVKIRSSDGLLCGLG